MPSSVGCVSRRWSEPWFFKRSRRPMTSSPPWTSWRPTSTPDGARPSAPDGRTRERTLRAPGTVVGGAYSSRARNLDVAPGALDSVGERLGLRDDAKEQRPVVGLELSRDPLNVISV